MRVALRQASLRGFSKGLERALFIGGVALLGYCAFVLLDAWAFQRAQQLRFEGPAGAGSLTVAKPQPAPLLLEPDDPPPLATGDLVGRIEIERLGFSVIVAEGVDPRTLRRAAGHIPGTALPGLPGNVGVAGHRDTFFRPLENVQTDDVIIFATLARDYRYRVVSTSITGPEDVAVLDPGPGEVLTLVTCHPFYFVGPAPDRFIVRAERF